MGKIGIHLDDEIGPIFQGEVKTGAICASQSGLLGAMQTLGDPPASHEIVLPPPLQFYLENYRQLSRY